MIGRGALINSVILNWSLIVVPHPLVWYTLLQTVRGARACARHGVGQSQSAQDVVELRICVIINTYALQSTLKVRLGCSSRV